MHPIDIYIKNLREKMKGSDPVLIQDAVFDATEHLTGAIDELSKNSPGEDPAELAKLAISRYGSPEEIARAYGSQNSGEQPSSGPSRASGFFGVIADRHTWTSILYLLFSLGTGIFYFTWAVTGISLSLGFIVLIIGLPFMGLFLLSIRSIAVFEGRLIEWMLGYRMPRHPIIDTSKKGLWEQFKSWISDGYTWSAMGFFVLMLPLGIIYFTLMVTFISVSLAFLAAPITHHFFNHEMLQFHHNYTIQPWVYYLLPLAGFILFFLTLHLARLLGRFQANAAKVMLVKG